MKGKPSEKQLAFLRGRNDKKRGVSRYSVPYADRVKAEAWEMGWDCEARRRRA